MKRTQLLELLCNIKATWVSFISIVMFVALGIGLYAGLCWTGQSIENAADAAFKQNNLHAFEMAFPYGFTDDDIDAIRSVEGVDEVDAGYASAQTLNLNEKAYNANVRSITEHVDVLTVDEGTLPASKNEIALNSLFAEANGIAVGDTISFAHDDATDADGMKYLNNSEFTVSALVTSPAYLAKNSKYFGASATGGAIDALAWTTEDAFDRAAFNGAYVTLEVSSNELADLNVYSSEYAAKSDEIKQRIEALGDTRADARYNDVIAQAQAKIDDGEAKLAEARQQLDDGSQKLADAQDQVNQNTRKLEDVQLELDVTLRMLNSQDSMTAEALAQAGNQITRYQQMFAQAQAQVNERLATVGVLEKEAQAISNFSDSSKKSLETLEARNTKISEDFEAGKISYEEYEAQLDKACEAFRADMKRADDTLKTDAPNLYAKNQKTIETFLGSCNQLTPTAVQIALPALSRSLTLMEGISGVAESSASQARQAADDATKQMNLVKQSLDEATALYNSKKAAYDAQISSARGEIASGQAQVDSGKTQLADAQDQIDAKKTELQSAQEEYESGQAQLAEAKEKVSQTVPMSWIVTSATYNGTIQALSEMVGILMRLRFSMASLFVIVGLLVCYSAVSRIVHEQITQVGTKKAIGFTAKEITFSYLAYTGIAVALGALVGIGVGMAAVEPILIPSLNQTIIANPWPIFSAGDFLLITAIDFALILAATWLACRGVLKRDAVELLQGEKPPSNRTRFYERWRLWRRLGLFTQTVINNCVNDKRRVLGTLVGVAGCTALIVSAITFNNNVNEGFDKQLAEVCTYDAVVYCNPDENAQSDDAAASGTAASSNDAGSNASTEAVAKSDAANNADGASVAAQANAKQSVNEYLNDQGLTHAAVQKKSFAINRPDGKQGLATVYTPADPDEFAKLFHLKTFASQTGTGVLDGAWVCSSYANYFNAKVGDSIELENSAGQKFEVPIAGFYEYYSFTSSIVLSQSAYERIMGSKVSYNAYLVDARDIDATAFQAGLAENTSDFVSYANEAQATKSLSATFNKLSFAMVAIYIALSVLMAIIVLLNLSVMFIDEKKRELIVLMINGYSLRDAKRYIYRDTIVMTAVGIVLGCLLGCAMGYLTAASLDSEVLYVIKTPNLQACLIGAALCAAFSAIITAISLRRIGKFSLTDINRF